MQTLLIKKWGKWKMDIWSKRMNGQLFPRSGGSHDLFQRLSDYVSIFDETWVDRIRPAPIGLFEILLEKANYKRWRRDIPQDYQVFVEKMGLDDGGLLSKALLGSANVEDILELYEEFHDTTPEALEIPFLAFFLQEMGGELVIDLSEDGNHKIIAATDGIFSWDEAESFEKLLFQSAYRVFEKNSNKYVSFGMSKGELKNILSYYEEKDVLSIADKIAKEYGMKRAWFSDFKHYIAFGNEVSFIVNSVYSAVGFITGENNALIQELKESFKTHIGVTIQKEHME